MHTRHSVRQTHELTYAISCVNASSHLWNVPTRRFGCRGLGIFQTLPGQGICFPFLETEKIPDGSMSKGYMAALRDELNQAHCVDPCSLREGIQRHQLTQESLTGRYQLFHLPWPGVGCCLIARLLVLPQNPSQVSYPLTLQNQLPSQSWSFCPLVVQH